MEADPAQPKLDQAIMCLKHLLLSLSCHRELTSALARDESSASRWLLVDLNRLMPCSQTKETKTIRRVQILHPMFLCFSEEKPDSSRKTIEAQCSHRHLIISRHLQGLLKQPFSSCWQGNKPWQQYVLLFAYRSFLNGSLRANTTESSEDCYFAGSFLSSRPKSLIRKNQDFLVNKEDL